MTNLTSLLVTCAVLGVSAASEAGPIGLCVIPGGNACNQYFFNFSRKSINTFALDGYEYGCGHSDRFASGVVRFTGDRLYLGFVGASRNEFNVDFGQTVTWSGNVSASTGTGVYSVLYVYQVGGGIGSHGVSADLELRLCVDPGLSLARGPSADERNDTSRPNP
jgi:hypothetical protein